MASASDKRFCVVLVLLLCFVSLIAVRLIQLQIIEHNYFNEMRWKRVVKKKILLEERGRIMDREGIILALDEPAITIYVEPKRIQDPNRVAKHLQQLTGIRYEVILDKLKPDAKTEVRLIANQLNIELKDALEKESIEGIYHNLDKRRLYPYSELTCHLLGWVGVDHYGGEGIEYLYDHHLEGKAGVRYQFVDALGKPLPRPPISSSPATKGKDLHLTLSKRDQEIALQILGGLANKHNIDEGTIIMMNAKSGKIAAMASYPFYNANNYRYYANRYPNMIYAYPAIRELFRSDPVLMLLLHSELLAQSSNIYRNRQHNTKANSNRDVSFTDNKRALRQYVRAFGKEKMDTLVKHWELDKETGIELRAHGSGMVQMDKIMHKGYGLYLSPLHLTRILAAIANGGILVKPRIILSEKSKEESSGGPDSASKKVMLAGIAKTLKKQLENNVLQGTEKAVQISGYNIGGMVFQTQSLLDMKGACFMGFISGGDLQEENVIVAVIKKQGMASSVQSKLAMECFHDFSIQMLEYEEALAKQY